MNQDLFQLALNITDPWHISDVDFNVESKRLDVYIDFKKGSTFSYEYADTLGCDTYFAKPYHS